MNMTNKGMPLRHSAHFKGDSLIEEASTAVKRQKYAKNKKSTVKIRF